MRLRKVVFCFGLGLASLTGVYVRADEIEALMAEMSQPKVALVLKKGDEEENPIPDLPQTECNLDDLR